MIFFIKMKICCCISERIHHLSFDYNADQAIIGIHIFFLHILYIIQQMSNLFSMKQT